MSRFGMAASGMSCPSWRVPATTRAAAGPASPGWGQCGEASATSTWRTAVSGLRRLWLPRACRSRPECATGHDARSRSGQPPGRRSFATPSGIRHALLRRHDWPFASGSRTAASGRGEARRIRLRPRGRLAHRPAPQPDGDSAAPVSRRECPIRLAWTSLTGPAEHRAASPAGARDRAGGPCSFVARGTSLAGCSHGTFPEIQRPGPRQPAL
jgi:hypothetical protein